MKQKINCWEYFDCTEKGCPVYKLKEHKCWLIPGTHCRNGIQGEFIEKIEMCLECEPFKANIDEDSLYDTLKKVGRQFAKFRSMVKERDRELERISGELGLGLSEVFDALKEISSGDPSVRIPETSGLELIAKLKHMVNLSAKNLAEIVNLSHEFAIGLAEHFDVMHRLTKGDLSTRVSGRSQVELLESLKKMTNQMIENVYREITERQWAEEALRESEEKYRTLFDSTPNSIFVLKQGTFNILDVNVRAVEIYGYEKEELIGKSFMDLGESHYHEGVLSGKAQEVSMLSSVYPKVQHYKKGGKPFYVNVYACQMKRSSKYGIIAVTVDITETLEKESLLIQASKMSTLGEMASGVAHELNQPLSAIQIGADFIHNVVSKDYQGLENLPEVSRHMREQVDRAVRIINHLREFGRKTEIKKEKLYINQPIEGVFMLLKQQLKLRDIEVVLDLKDDLPPIMGERNRLEQVFINLIVNARNAMEEKRKAFVVGDVENILTVKSYQEGGHVVVTISDTGTGISDEIKDKIFEPFFTTKKVGEGTGLGLSISYGIVKDYDGTIEVESEPGKGTTFRLSFPACDEGKSGR